MKKNVLSRILSLAICACLVCVMLPMAAPAAETDHTHVWSDEWSGNGSYHWHNCTAEGCDLPAHLGKGKDGLAHHEFDIADSSLHSFSQIEVIHFGTCVICGKTDSQILHVTTLQKDDTHHWSECPCGVIGWIGDQEKAEHSFDDDADTTCNDCGYDRTPKHEHVWSDQWSGNEWAHWHDCTADGCDLPANLGGYNDGFGYHEFDFADSTHVNCVDSKNVLHKGTCMTCGETEALNYFEEVTIKSDETHHWYECSCGVTEWAKYFEKGEHRFDDDADTTCNDCGYVRTASGGTTVNGVITLTPADLENGEASGEGWSFAGNNLAISSGYTLKFDGTCGANVDNYGTIESGTFYGFVDNDGTITGGTFSGHVENSGTIESGTFYGVVYNDGTITAGTFSSPVDNYGTIEGGTFYGVSNYGTITGGTFLHTVENLMGTISGGTFAGKLTHKQGSISGITIELSNALIEGGESYGWSLDADNNLILNSGISFYWKAGEPCEYRVENNGTITGGTFSGGICFNHDDGTIESGTFSSFVDNNGTITGGTFSSDVDNGGTISGGKFTSSLSGGGIVTGTADLSELTSLDIRYGLRFGKGVKLPQAVMKGELTYTGCENSTEITLEYYADGVKTDTWTVSGERYSYPVEGYKRTDPAAELSALEEITHEVKVASMDGYDITVTKANWDRFNVTVTALHTHSYGTEWKSDGTNHWRECSCGAKTGDAAHSGGTATCTEKAVCETCGTAYGEANPDAHTYISIVTDPTCTEKGYTTHTCACGDSRKDTYVDALGHSFTRYTSDDNATCKSDGTETAECDNDCGETDTRTDKGSKLGHNYKNGVCTRCDKEEGSPDTGDMIAIAVSLLALSGCGLVALLSYGKKKKI